VNFPSRAAAVIMLPQQHDIANHVCCADLTTFYALYKLISAAAVSEAINLFTFAVKNCKQLSAKSHDGHVVVGVVFLNYSFRFFFQHSGEGSQRRTNEEANKNFIMES